ncbi:hypothetical protein L2E82_20475 [Cichorium intybus]|uniref:Uncharacterized protein n=1 Tax=Cichorium intybus TaxID=13427 RepID=A0ACB9DT50_CICIN|nr:hypothetical protein L2E82_20475 [Cichorium intybus]
MSSSIIRSDSFKSDRSDWYVFLPEPIFALHSRSRAAAKAVRVPICVSSIIEAAVRTGAQCIMKSEADKIGYPLLIKPTHGGGGKGMRIVENPKEFVDAFLGAQREAAASFGVNTILLEKYITRPRHIEVQMLSIAGAIE